MKGLHILGGEKHSYCQDTEHAAPAGLGHPAPHLPTPTAGQQGEGGV